VNRKDSYNQQSTINSCKDGGFIMNSVDFQKYFEQKIKQFNQSLAKEGSIQQFKSFARSCEKLRLYALAAQAFRRLTVLDPKNKKQYREHVLSNTRKAGGKRMPWLFPSTQN
jgi:hypothetical protein